MSSQAPSSVRWTSSAATRCGPHHAVNEDSYGDLEAAGLFVVADGVGGHSDGDVASGAVCGVLDEVVRPQDDIETRVLAVEEALRAINAVLWREARNRPQPTIIATTVATLLLVDNLAACVWAGDSRIYLYRDGHLYQLTRDHNLEVEFGTSGHAGGQLTRAVGSAAELDLERVVTEACSGDVFLLCSDGVTKVLDDVELAHFLENATDGLAPRLIGAVADRGGPDDATAIVVRYARD